MITLDTDLYLICSMFNISYKKLSNEYSGMAIEDVMEAEAAQGNTAAANFDKSVLSDPIKLIKLFKLNDVGNKYAILSNMNERDLEDLLPLLKPEDLVMGLNFFTKDKLLKLMGELPKEQLVNVAFQMFSPEQLVFFMPDEQLDKFLKSEDLDKAMILKFLPTVKPEILAQMIEAATGQQAMGQTNMNMSGEKSYDKQALLAQITSLPEDKFQEAMINMPPIAKREFIVKLTKDNPKLFQIFDAEAYTEIIRTRKNKDDMIKSAVVIEPEQLVKMIQELPKDLMAIVLTQIDTKKFADILISKFKDILGEVVAG